MNQSKGEAKEMSNGIQAVKQTIGAWGEAGLSLHPEGSCEQGSSSAAHANTRQMVLPG